MPLRPLLSPSGGLEWHLRAWRQRDGLWRDFRDELGRWLATWRPDARDLLLLGPSAGWCLPDEFLTRFRSIHVVDLDPLAALLFRQLHRRALVTAGTRLSAERADAIVTLDRLLARHPDHAVLFANMLGQRRFHRTDWAATEFELATLGPRLAGRSWGSFHDRLSGRVRELAAAPRPFSVTAPLPADALAQRVGATGEWLDHLTTGVLPDAVPRRIMPWRLRPDRVHWIEAGWA